MPLGGLVLKSRYNVQANVSENELSVGDCPDFYRSKTINRLEQDLSMDRHSNGRVESFSLNQKKFLLSMDYIDFFLLNKNVPPCYGFSSF